MPCSAGRADTVCMKGWAISPPACPTAAGARAAELLQEAPGFEGAWVGARDLENCIYPIFLRASGRPPVPWRTVTRALGRITANASGSSLTRVADISDSASRSTSFPTRAVGSAHVPEPATVVKGTPTRAQCSPFWQRLALWRILTGHFRLANCASAPARALHNKYPESCQARWISCRRRLVTHAAGLP